MKQLLAAGLSSTGTTATIAGSALVLLPILALFWLAVSGDSDGQLLGHLLSNTLGEYTLGSLELVTGVAFLTLSIGTTSAWIITRFDFLGRKTLSWALMLPLAMPAYITAYAYTGMLDVGGDVPHFIENTLGFAPGQYWLPEIRSRTGAIIVISLALYPYVYLLTRQALESQSQGFQNVATTLGYSQFQTFRKVTLPIARPAVIAGLGLALMETLGDYGTVAYFGVSTFTTGIFRSWYGLDSIGLASTLAIALFFFVGILYTLEQVSRSRALYAFSGSSRKPVRQKLKSHQQLLAFSLAAAPLIFGFIIPATRLLVWVWEGGRQQFDESFIVLAWNSLLLGSIASAVIIALALTIASRHRLQPSKLLAQSHRLITLGYALPGTVIALGLLIPLSYLDAWIDNTVTAIHDNLSWGLILSASLLTLVLALAARFSSVALQAINAGYSQIPTNVDKSARLLGASPWSLFSRIHLPLLRGSVWTAALIVFVESVKELPATLMLRPFNFNTLAIRAHELAADERLADAALPALTIVLVGLLPVLLLNRAASNG